MIYWKAVMQHSNNYGYIVLILFELNDSFDVFIEVFVAVFIDCGLIFRMHQTNNARCVDLLWRHILSILLLGVALSVSYSR